MFYDFLVIGAGISGASAGYELAQFGQTLIVEAESNGSFHSTGRSAALYTPNYGSDLVCRINKLSYGFLATPPSGFTTDPLLRRRGMLRVAPKACEELLLPLLASGGTDLEALDIDQTLALAPFLRSDRVSGAVYEKDVADIDVHALHQGFLSGYRQRGGTFIYGEPVRSLEKGIRGWNVVVGDQVIHAQVVVNAAGAWAEKIGAMAGSASIGLIPKRRTAIMVDAPVDIDVSRSPAIDFVGVDNYIKPESGQLMVSPGDATPVAAQDIQPDDFEIAQLVDWFEKETTIEVNRLNHRWAGLRSFVKDGAPVVGFDPLVDDFFWLAGQGGYGIMMSCALARATAELIKCNRLPQDFIDAGVEESALSVNRLLNN